MFWLLYPPLPILYIIITHMYIYTIAAARICWKLTRKQKKKNYKCERDTYSGFRQKWGRGRQAWDNSKGALFYLFYFHSFIFTCMHTCTHSYMMVAFSRGAHLLPFYPRNSSLQHRTFISIIPCRCTILTTHLLWLRPPFTNRCSSTPPLPHTSTSLLRPGSHPACYRTPPTTPHSHPKRGNPLQPSLVSPRLWTTLNLIGWSSR